MSNYFDDMLASILELKRFPEGREKKVWNKETGEYDTVPIAENYQTQNDIGKARMEASQKEDDMLRYQLGTKRKRRKGDVEGSYSLAWYPRLEHEIKSAGKGLGNSTMAQAMHRMTPEEREAFKKKLREWANRQGSMMDTVEGRRGPQLGAGRVIDPILDIGRGY